MMYDDWLHNDSAANTCGKIYLNNKIATMDQSRRYVFNLGIQLANSQYN